MNAGDTGGEGRRQEAESFFAKDGGEARCSCREQSPEPVLPVCVVSEPVLPVGVVSDLRRTFEPSLRARAPCWRRLRPPSTFEPNLRTHPSDLVFLLGFVGYLMGFVGFLLDICCIF